MGRACFLRLRIQLPGSILGRFGGFQLELELVRYHAYKSGKLSAAELEGL